MDDTSINDKSIHDSTPHDVKFFVTGFGPFCGVTCNPTTILVNRLRDFQSQSNSDLQINTMVFETSAVNVRTEMDQFFDRINAMHEEQNEGQHYVILHLGVAYNAKNIRLEKCAYNEATFRVPDERQYQPNRKCVVENSDLELGACLETKLNLIDLRNEYEDIVTLSIDPGRFVCNYTYFYSLEKASSLSADDSRMGIKADVLFVHVPPFSEIDEERQFQFILDLIRSIQKKVHLNHMKD